MVKLYVQQATTPKSSAKVPYATSPKALKPDLSRTGNGMLKSERHMYIPCGKQGNTLRRLAEVFVYSIDNCN